MGEWKQLKSKIVYENQWIKLEEDNVLTPSGKEGTYTTIVTKPFVIVLAVKDDHIIMVNQQRYTVGHVTQEFPAGSFEENEDALAAAKRELLEETGYEARNWLSLGYFNDAVSIARHKGNLFVATDLHDTGEDKMAEEGIYKRDFIAITDIISKIKNNEINDPKVIAALYKYQLATTK